MRFIKVHRDAAEGIVAFYEIEENGSQLLFRSDSVQIKTKAGVTAERVTLPSGILPASFWIVVIDEDKAQVLLRTGNEGTNWQVLKPGRYKAMIRVSHDVKEYRAKRNFIVQNKYPLAYWDVSSW